MLSAVVTSTSSITSSYFWFRYSFLQQLARLGIAFLYHRRRRAVCQAIDTDAVLGIEHCQRTGDGSAASVPSATSRSLKVSAGSTSWAPHETSSVC